MISKVKLFVKRIIQYVIYQLLPELKVNKSYRYYLLGKEDHIYVGYYDIDPVNLAGEKVLCHRVSTQFTRHAEPEVGDIGLISINRPDQFKKVGETRALNWQLGSRLRWVSEREIIYNDIVDGRQCAILFDLDNEVVKQKLCRPFWALSPNTKIGVSLNFSRLKVKRAGYGYAGISPDGNDDILTIFDVSTDSVLFQIALDELLRKIDFDLPAGADAYFNHVTWSPCSKKFITLFLFEDPISRKRFSYPVLVCCVDYSVSLFHDEGLFSHHVWLDDKRVMAFLRLNGANTFAIWNGINGWIQTKKNMPLLDGHPSVVYESDDIIVDSYPDRFGRMFLYKGSTNENRELVKISSLMNAGGYSSAQRCDLHPRVSRDNKYIICDVPDKHGRRILIIENNDNSIDS